MQVAVSPPDYEDRGAWVGSLPPQILVSYGKHTSRPNRPMGDTWLQSSSAAHLYPLVGIVRPVLNEDTGVRLRKFVAVDCDNEFGDVYRAFQKRDIPLPAFAVVNMLNGHSHLAWRLFDVDEDLVWSEIKQIEQRLCALLGGDPGYTSVTIRNPFALGNEGIWCQTPLWFDPDKQWDAGDLLDRIPLPTLAQESALREQAERGGRNSTLYGKLWQLAKTDPNVNLAAAGYAMNMTFEPPLPDREVRQVVCSVERGFARARRRESLKPAKRWGRLEVGQVR